MAEILFAAELAFSSLNRGVAQQELNLLDLAAVCVAQLRAGPAQIIRRDVLQPSSLAATLDDIPDNILRDAITPHFVSRHGPEDSPFRDPRRRCPVVERCLDPIRDRHGTNVPALPD